MKIFGREPAVILAFIAAALKLAAAFGLKVSDDQQGVINTVLSCLVAVALVVVLHQGSLYAALVNLAQAGMSLFLAFGLELSGERQALIMASLAALLAVFGVRPQVQAPVAVLPRLETSSPYTKQPVDRAA
jgi:uncharacterized membrane protein